MGEKGRATTSDPHHSRRPASPRLWTELHPGSYVAQLSSYSQSVMMWCVFGFNHVGTMSRRQNVSRQVSNILSILDETEVIRWGCRCNSLSLTAPGPGRVAARERYAIHMLLFNFIRSSPLNFLQFAPVYLAKQRSRTAPQIFVRN